MPTADPRVRLGPISEEPSRVAVFVRAGFICRRELAAHGVHHPLEVISELSASCLIFASRPTHWHTRRSLWGFLTSLHYELCQCIDPLGSAMAGLVCTKFSTVPRFSKYQKSTLKFESTLEVLKFIKSTTHQSLSSKYVPV